MKYLFLNHKMNLDKREIEIYNKEFSKLVWNNIEVCIFPTFTNMSYLDSTKYNIGSQNVSRFQAGSYTGEVSAHQLKSVGVTYALVGHSERRHILNESEEEILEKIKRLQEEDIIPVLCIGETKGEDREETLKRQLSSAFQTEIKDMMIAYEPVYSIGTGLVLENDEIESSIQFIKEYVKKEYNRDIPVLYGGSVDEKNIAILKGIENIDGFLIGKASLTVEKVKKIMEELK